MLSSAFRIVVSLWLVVISLLIVLPKIVLATNEENVTDITINSLGGAVSTNDSILVTGKVTVSSGDPTGINVTINLEPTDGGVAKDTKAVTEEGGTYKSSGINWALETGKHYKFKATAGDKSQETPEFVVIQGNTAANSSTDPGGAPATNANYTPHVHTGFTLENVLSNIAGCWVIGGSLVGGGARGQATGGAGNVPSGSGAGCPQFDANGNLMVYNRVPGGGALGGVSTVMAAMYSNPPTSSKEYLADLGSNLGLVDKAYAQVSGSGDSVLKPILDLWKVSRNLAYLAFILILVVVGLMIMFRRRLNPQTVISVQSALPGLVIGLILVTFSYFLAALIVDTSFVGMKLAAFIFQQSGLPNIINDADPLVGPNTQGASSLASNGNIFGLWWSFLANDSLRSNIIAPLTSYFNVTKGLKDFFNESVLGTPQGINIFGLNINPLGGVADTVGGVGSILGTGIGLLITAIIILALLIQMLRLLWSLVSAYITVLVFSIAGPILIAIGSIPGRGGAISYWWKTLLGNVLIFPAVFAAFLFAGTFLASAEASQSGQIGAALPLFSGIQIPILKAIIGYGLVLASPAIPGLVKQALGVKDITALQQAAFGGIAAGFAPFKAGAERVYKPYKQQFEAQREATLRRYYAQVEQAKGESERELLTGGRGVRGLIYRTFYKPSVPLRGGGTSR